MTLLEILAERRRKKAQEQADTATELQDEQEINAVQGLLLVPLVAVNDEFSEYF